MSHFSIVHEFDADPQAYWKVFFDEAFNQELYRRIRVRERKVLEWKETEDTIFRSIRIHPDRDLPGFLKRIVGGDLGYVETSTFYRKRNDMDVKVEPTLLREKTTITGRYWLDDVRPGRVRRTFAGDMDVRVPLVGKKIEEFLIAETTRSYDIAAQTTAEFLTKAIL